MRRMSSGDMAPSEVVVLYQYLVGQFYQIAFFFAVLGRDDDFLVASFYGSEFNYAVDFSNDCRIGRIAGFEQFGHTRQTAGDVACFGALSRNFYQYLTGLYLCAVVHHKVSADR